MTPKHESDPDVTRAFKWLIDKLGHAEWKRRRRRIEESIEPLFDLSLSSGGFRRVTLEDQIAWYLFLVETTEYTPTLTAEDEAARVVPVFRRLGADLEQLQTIAGLDDQVRRLLSEKSKPDTVLFEMLIGLLYVKNGWSNAEFIPPSPHGKSPDIRVWDQTRELYAETKRLNTTSGYSAKERQKWLRMWRPLSEVMLRRRYPFILDIVFHVELADLDDHFAARELESKLGFVIGPCELISNETWQVSVKPVNFPRIDSHLHNWDVKVNSRQLQELVGGGWDRRRGYTHILDASHHRIGEGVGFNRYISDIRWAAGAYWHCDADAANEAKARDIRAHLAKAVKQIPAGKPGTIHAGIETFDGEDVEAIRFNRIMRTVRQFDANGKDLRWVYVHLYESYAPPSTSWFFDETVYPFGSPNRQDDPLLLNHASIVPELESECDDAHWLRPPPE